MPKLSAIIFNLVAVISVFANSIKLIMLLEMPLTPMGKIDYRLLKEIGSESNKVLKRSK